MKTYLLSNVANSQVFIRRIVSDFQLNFEFNIPESLHTYWFCRECQGSNSLPLVADLDEVDIFAATYKIEIQIISRNLEMCMYEVVDTLWSSKSFFFLLSI